MDRVIQQAIAQVLTPIFDPGFSASSFGFRPGRNAHQAIKQVQRHVKDGYAMAVDINGVPAAQAGTVRAGLDGVLWHQRVLPVDPGTG
ncbi:MAG: hypothetical protein WAX67_05950 [Rugosibacter sp.]